MPRYTVIIIISGGVDDGNRKWAEPRLLAVSGLIAVPTSLFFFWFWSCRFSLFGFPTFLGVFFSAWLVRLWSQFKESSGQDPFLDAIINRDLGTRSWCLVIYLSFSLSVPPFFFICSPLRFYHCLPSCLFLFLSLSLTLPFIAAIAPLAAVSYRALS